MKYGLLIALAFIVGCAERSSNTGRVDVESASTVAFNASGAPTVQFDVPDMMCPEGCGAKTKEILSGLPGAKEVAINFEAKTATVAIEDGQFDPAAALTALKDYGFDNSTLKSSDAGKPESNGVAEEPAS